MSTLEIVCDFSNSEFVKCESEVVIRSTAESVYISDGQCIWKNKLHDGTAVFTQFLSSYKIVGFDINRGPSGVWFIALQHTVIKNRYIIVRKNNGVTESTLNILHNGPNNGGINFNEVDDGNMLFVFENDTNEKMFHLVKYVWDKSAKMYYVVDSVAFKDRFTKPANELYIYDDKYIFVRESQCYDTEDLGYRKSHIDVFDVKTMKKVAHGKNGDVFRNKDNLITWYTLDTASCKGTVTFIDDEFKKLVVIEKSDKDIMTKFSKGYGTFTFGKFESHITVDNVKYVLKCDGMSVFITKNKKIHIKRNTNEIGIFDFTMF